MNDKQIHEMLSIHPETLAENQYKALKTYSMGRIKELYKLLEADELETIETLLAESPSGDGYGSDNTFYSFGYIFSDKYVADIGDVIRRLKTLRGN